MSRIEEAMEKAARLRREGGGEQAPVEKAEAARVKAPSGSYPRVESTLSPVNPFLVNLHEPHSPVAEEYRKLKSVLVKMTSGERFRNLIMVTSSLPSEGKSLTAVNLALTLAQELDHTVLLVDADLRRPSLHRYLEMEQGVGLSDVLSGKAEVADTLVPTGIGKLTVMRAGGHADNPVELFSSQRMKDLLAELKHRYPDRYVIFDTTPVLPFAEGRTLSHLVDGVLFVVMERLAAQESIKDALESLKGADLLGLVYNGAEFAPRDERYAYYRNYDRGAAKR